MSRLSGVSLASPFARATVIVSFQQSSEANQRPITTSIKSSNFAKLANENIHRQILVSHPVVRPLGRSLITISSSLSICVLEWAVSFAIVCPIRSSFLFAILSSLVKVLLCRGSATASNISSPELLVVVLERDRVRFGRPLSACRDSWGLPPTMAVPPKLEVRDTGRAFSVVENDLLWSALSRLVSKAALPCPHSSIKPFRSAPIESYCARRFVPVPDLSSVRSKATLDSSLKSLIFAWRPRTPCDKLPNCLNWLLMRSLPGVNGTFGVDGDENSINSWISSRHLYNGFNLLTFFLAQNIINVGRNSRDSKRKAADGFNRGRPCVEIWFASVCV